MAAGSGSRCEVIEKITTGPSDELLNARVAATKGVFLKRSGFENYHWKSEASTTAGLHKHTFSTHREMMIYGR